MLSVYLTYSILLSCICIPSYILYSKVISMDAILCDKNGDMRMYSSLTLLLLLLLTIYSMYMTKCSCHDRNNVADENASQ